MSKPFINIENRTFGRLTVIRFAYKDTKHERRWLCKCQCGTEIIVRYRQLTSGGTRSCGCLQKDRAAETAKNRKPAPMPRRYNYLNMRFDRLFVIAYVGLDKGQNRLWKCICDCGNETIVTGRSLGQGITKSCGCLKSDVARELRSLPHGEAAFNELYRTYAQNAKKRNYPFDLSKDIFRELTKQVCYYCGKNPYREFNAHNNGAYVYNGLDRVDNTKGYTISNVVPCCKICNRAKDIMSVEEFKQWVKDVYSNLVESDVNVN